MLSHTKLENEIVEILNEMKLVDKDSCYFDKVDDKRCFDLTGFQKKVYMI